MTEEQKETWGGVLIVVLVLGAGLAAGNKGCVSSTPPPVPAPHYRQVPGPGGGSPYPGGGTVDPREHQRIRQQHENRMREIQEEKRRWEEERRRQDERFRGNPYMR